MTVWEERDVSETNQMYTLQPFYKANNFHSGTACLHVTRIHLPAAASHLPWQLSLQIKLAQMIRVEGAHTLIHKRTRGECEGYLQSAKSSTSLVDTLILLGIK